MKNGNEHVANRYWMENIIGHVARECICIRLVAILEEKSPDQVEVFKTNMNKVMKDILSRFKELQFFTGTSMDIDGIVGLMEYREIDGASVPVLMFFKHGLEEEKF